MRASVCASGLLLFLLSLFLQVLVVLVVCVQQLVPPGEGGGVVPDEVHVVEVVETSAGVEWDQVERVERDVVSTDGKKRDRNKYANSLNIQKLLQQSKIIVQKYFPTHAF